MNFQQPKPENSFQNALDDADAEDNDEFENRQAAELLKPEETGQNWLLRHLKFHLENVPETILSEFIMQQDITVFRNFLSDPQRRQCLFILIEREKPLERPQNRYFDPNPLVVDEKDIAEKVEEVDNSKDQEMELDRELLEQADKPVVKRKARKMRPSKRSKKQKSKSPKKKKKSKSPKKVKSKKEESKKAMHKTQNAEQQPNGTLPAFPDDPFAVDLTTQQKIEINLRWHNGRKIPMESLEFVFLATRDEPNTGVTSEFDRVFVVGYCRYAEKFKRVLELAEIILKDMLNFERKIDILLQLELPTNIHERREKWQNVMERFENFIVDSLVYSMSTQKRSQMDNMVEADAEVPDFESIESLLKSRVRDFTKTATKQAAIQLKLELSLYEMKFLVGEMYSERVVERLNRIVTLFSVIFMLYHQTNGEWIQKALFHCVELTARIISTNMNQRVWNLVYEDCEGERNATTIGDEKHASIMTDLKPILLELIDLGFKAIARDDDEYLCLERIKRCVKILGIIEEEFEKLKGLIGNMRNKNRDMSFNRKPIEDARLIVRDVWNTFEESYLESALESGNYDAIKAVCLQLAQLNIQMAETIPQLDEFCKEL